MYNSDDQINKNQDGANEPLNEPLTDRPQDDVQPNGYNSQPVPPQPVPPEPEQPVPSQSEQPVPPQPQPQQQGQSEQGYAGAPYAQDPVWQYPPYEYNYAPVKKKRSGLRALVAVLLVVCLFGGVAAGTFLVAPNLKFLGFLGGVQELPQNTPDVPPVTGQVPEIGGEAPDIAVSNSPIVQIAKEVGPAIVGVTVSVDERMGRMTTEVESGYGTGIILTQDGYIVTNNHVIAGSDYIRITLYDATEYKAVLVGVDKATDLAVLKIDAKGLKPAALGNSDILEVGEGVVAIGNPLGATLAGSVTSGIVSALNRQITTNGYSQNYIQTDAAINPGNSGGALVNMRGEVIGINTLKSFLAGFDNFGLPIGTEGIGFAIPISSARSIIEQLIATGSVERPGIGISCFADPTGTPTGVTVAEVTEGGQADQAGLLPEDIITSVDGVKVETVEELTSYIQSKKIGDELLLTVWRSGQEYQATVVVGNLNNMG